MVDNWSWWREVGAVEFVSDIARPFRVAAMLAKERSEFWGCYLDTKISSNL